MQLRKLQCGRRHGPDSDHDAGIAAAEFLNKGSQEPARKRTGTADPHLAAGWIGKKLDVPHALFQFIESCDPTLEEGATIDGRLDALGAAVEETNAECVLQAGNDFR